MFQCIHHFPHIILLKSLCFSAHVYYAYPLLIGVLLLLLHHNAPISYLPWYQERALQGWYHGKKERKINFQSDFWATWLKSGSQFMFSKMRECTLWYTWYPWYRVWKLPWHCMAPKICIYWNSVVKRRKILNVEARWDVCKLFISRIDLESEPFFGLQRWIV